MECSRLNKSNDYLFKMSFLSRCLDWTKEKSDWQADLFRRALERNTDLTISEDWDEIRRMVRKSIGVPVLDGLAAVNPVRPDPSAFSGANPESKKIVLKSIECVSNINAIPDGSILPFGHVGLTVVYGENGSGKSSYARVLKKACRARDTEDIHPNVFLQKDSRLGKAKLKYSFDGGIDEFENWSIDSSKSTPLSSVIVFDSKCGRLILEKEAELQYAPYGTDAFLFVVKAQQVLVKELESETPNPVKPTIGFKSPNSKASLVFDSIKLTSKFEDVRESLIWSDENQSRLEEVLELGRKAKETNNDAKIKEAKSELANIANAIQHLRDLIGMFSKESIASYNFSLNALQLAREEQRVHASTKLGNEPISSAGSDIWKNLYRAAREFSVKEAYPEKPFPFVDQESVCVWCMQKLEPDAIDRLARFESFMDDSIAKKIKLAETAFSVAKEKLLGVAPWDSSRFYVTTAPLKVQQPGLRDLIDTVFKSLSQYFFSALEKAQTLKNIADFIAPVLPETDISSWLEIRKAQIKNWEDASNPETIAKLRAEYIELEDQKTLSQNLNVIEDYLKQSASQRIYMAAIDKLSTMAVSRKLGELIKEMQTPELQRALSVEMQSLDAQGLPISFASMGGGGGQPKHKMQLVIHDSHKRLDPSQILSEGEQRVIALAGFLTELSLDGNRNPIVFDDPVTSLDHRFREKIALRIAKEALTRQVIVFTHDLAFLFELEKAMGELEGGYFQAITVCKDHGSPGECQPKPPWDALAFGDRISTVESEFSKTSPIYTSSVREYNKNISILYSMLRDAMETLIEDEIFYKVVNRFQREVKTLRLNGVSLEHEDYKQFTILYDRCCTWMIGHSKSKNIDANRPNPDEFKKHLMEIKALKTKLSSQRKKTEADRKKLFEAQTPSLG